MKKGLLSILVTLFMFFILLPQPAEAVLDPITVGSGGNYELTEAGLNAAISAASSVDTIKFISSGTINLSVDVNVYKSITLDLNNQNITFIGDTTNFGASFYGLNIPDNTSVAVKGPGTISTDNHLFVRGATLTIQDGAVLEGTGVWQTLINYGTVNMTGGILKHSNGGFVLQNSGTATFTDVMIESNSGREPVLYTQGTLNLNNCTVKNTLSGTGSWNNASLLWATLGTVVLNNGTLTSPEGSSAATVNIGINATYTNNGASIINGYIKNLGDLTVSVSSGTDKVILAAQTPEEGVTYYYKTTASDDTANKPPTYESTAFIPTDWSSFDTITDIPTIGTGTVYVQVAKVGDIEQKIYGWGQNSATPTSSTHTVTATAGIGGSISPSGSINVDNNGLQHFEIRPNNNYSIANVLVDGVSHGKITSYTFHDVTANHTIAASFSYNGSSGGGSFGGSDSGGTTTNNDKPKPPTPQTPDTSKEPIVEEKPTNKITFADIKGHWAEQDIEFTASQGLFSGTTETTFTPDTAMTRGMFVTVLGRLANANVSSYTTSSFSDVESQAYYSSYIEWANANHIASGIGDEKFAPEQPITREQLAVIIQKYSQVKGIPLPVINKESKFADHEKISPYAQDAVNQMQIAGILIGKNKNLFDPQGTATRAEVASVIQRFSGLVAFSHTL